MRRIRDALRLALDERQSIRMISKSVGVSRDAITDYLTRFKVAERAGSGFSDTM